MKNSLHLSRTGLSNPSNNNSNGRLVSRVRLLAILILLLSSAFNICMAQTTNYFNGFETGTGTDDWADVTRVASGTNGINSAMGGFHAEVAGGGGSGITRFGRVGGGAYNPIFPPCGYKTSLAVYLDVSGGWANDARFDYSSAINDNTGNFRRDFVFNVGFYNDGSTPGTGNRFVITASNNAGRANSFPENPARSPQVISVSGWYTFEHSFRNNGGFLVVDLTIYDAGNSPVASWTLSDPTDIIGTTVGGSRYGWLLNNEFSPLAIDNSALTISGNGNLVTNTSTLKNYCTIQAAIDDPLTLTGHTITVSAGNYDEDVTVSKSVILKGAGVATTKIRGVIGGPGSTVAIAANNVEISGFTVTRLGNNTTDWNNPGNNTVGISVQGGFTGMLIHDNIITQNRSGIDINNSSGHTIRNNIITDNHTGLIFRNTTNNITITENEITNNRTVGIVFLDGSSGTNVPAQTSTNSIFYNNNISGNWYAQIVDRQTGSSLPAAGGSLKNFSGNWLGTNTPILTPVNSAEPGYTVLIPVEFGGSATAPGGQPDIAGPASANFDFTPFLNAGTDVNIETVSGRGTFGFQGSFSNLWVTASGAQTGAITRIQEGVNLVSGSIVNVTAGTYNENVIINTAITLQGAGNTTILTPSAACSGNGITINANNTIVKDLQVTNYTYGIVVAASAITLDNIESISNCTAGIEMGNGINGLTVKNSKINTNTFVGLRAGTGAQMSNITIDNCEVKGNVQGMFIAASTGGSNSFDNISIKNSDFSNNKQKGMYFEKLSNALIENIVMMNSGTDVTYNNNAGIDINLKYGSYSNITIRNNSLTNCGAVGTALNAQAPVALTIKARDDAPSYNTIPATLTNVDILNNIINGPQNGIRFGESGITNNTPTDVEVHNNDLSGPFANKTIINNTPGTVNATCNWFGTVTAGVIASRITGPVTYAPWATSGTDNSTAPGFQTSEVCAACALVVSAVSTDATCPNLNNGTATANVISGGTGPYSYNWLGYVPGNLDGQNGWNGGIGGFTNYNPGDADVVNSMAHNGSQSWYFKNGYNSPGQGSPFSPVVASVGALANGTAGNQSVIQLSFKPAVLNDGSRITIYEGSVNRDDRTGANLYIENIAGGLVSLYMFRSDDDGPTNDYSAQENIGTYPGNVWNTVKMVTDYPPTNNGDRTTWGTTKYYVNDVLVFTESTWPHWWRFNHAFAYTPGSSIKFTNNNAGAGFYIDDVSMTVNNTVTAQTVATFSTGFEQSPGSTQSISNLVPGSYPVIVTDASGCTATATATVSAGAGPVHNLNTGLDYCTIQAAIDATATVNGHTIKVDAGTYNESVTVNKELIIKGAKAGVLGKGRSGPESIVDPNSPTANGFKIVTDNVTIDGFTITNSAAYPAPERYGVVSIEKAGTGNFTGLVVKNNIITRQFKAVNFNFTDNFEISNNWLHGENDPYNGSCTWVSSYGTSSSNGIIKNNDLDGYSSAIEIQGALAQPVSNITVSENRSTGSQYALFGLQNSTVYRNTVLNVTVGSHVFIGGGCSNVVFSENFFDNGSSSGIRITNIGNGINSALTFTNNSITGHNAASAFEINVDASAYDGTVPATCNWFGSTNGAVIASKITGPVNYTPWLTSGADGSVDPGFQPTEVCSACPSFTAGITNNSGSTELTCSRTAINVTATGGTGYSWDGGATPTTAANSFSTPGTYTVIVTAANGCTSTKSITITQNTTPPTAGITNNTGSTELTCTRTSISVTATGGVSYSWDGGNTPTTAANTFTAAGTYTVTVKGANGCTSTKSITITQNAVLPNAAITNNTGTTVLTCTTTSIQVTATGGGSYSWTGGLGNAAAATITAPGTYTVTVTSANGCMKTASITITQNAVLPNAAITNNTGTTVLTCTTTAIQVTATGGGTYSWTGGLGSAAAATITAPGTYTVTVTSANGCKKTASITITQNAVLPNAAITNNTGTTVLTCTTTSIKVTATGGGSYSWTGGLGNAAAATITAPGTYTVTVTSANGCKKTASITITQSAVLPNAAITNNTGTTVLTCTTTSIKVTATGGGSYSWTGGLGSAAAATITAPGTYTVTVTSPNGCKKTASITITQSVVLPNAAITNNTGTTVLTCTTTSIKVTATGGGTYSWTGGLGNAAAATITAAGTYTVTVTSANGCKKTASITITKNVTPPVAGTINGSSAICLGATSTFTIAGNSIVGTWSSSNTSVATVTSTGVVNGIHEGTAIIKYTVTNSCGSSVASKSVTVGSNAVAITCPVTGSCTRSAGASCKYTISGTEFNPAATCGCGTPVLSYTLSGATSGTGTALAGVQLNKGLTTITWKATMGSVNSTCSFTANVTDNQKPVISCKPGATKTIAASASYYIVSGTEFNASASDNCGAPSLIYCLSGATVSAYAPANTSLAGKKLNVGSTTITWKATDGSDNVSTCATVIKVTKASYLAGGSETISNSFTAKDVQAEASSLRVRVIPNPSPTYFTLQVTSRLPDKLNIIVTDILGRTIEMKTHIVPNSTIQVGSYYAPGTYIAKIIQGKETVPVKLFKIYR